MAKKGLGKGLDALFAEEENEQSVLEVKITEVMPNKNQPRKTFDEEKLESLAESVKEHGIIQPIIVKKTGEFYTIIAGERRWRAAKIAGLKKIPVLVRDFEEVEIREIALIENLQREDLNPIEEALGYRSLMDEYNFTQEQISERLGKSRSAIANSVRLLTLDEYTTDKLIAGEITEGHARCALSVPAGVVREFFVNRIIEDGLNVRQAENLAKDLVKTPAEKQERPKSNAYKIELERISENLAQFLGTKVKLSGNSKKGKIEIEYYGNADLERLLDIIRRG